MEWQYEYRTVSSFDNRSAAVALCDWLQREGFAARVRRSAERRGAWIIQAAGDAQQVRAAVAAWRADWES